MGSYGFSVLEPPAYFGFGSASEHTVECYRIYSRLYDSYLESAGGVSSMRLRSGGERFLTDRVSVVCGKDESSAEEGSSGQSVVEVKDGVGSGSCDYARGDGRVSDARGECVGGDDVSSLVEGRQSVSSDEVLGVKSKGKWYERNKKKKERRKLEKVKSCSGNVQGDGGLQRSLEKKWAAENALAEEKARQQLELLKARDIESVKRMQRAQVMRTTEVCKVQTEKAFGTLRRTGNVGSAETVVSVPGMTDGSTARSNGESVSPDSSISQSEIRQMQKEIIDLKRESELAEKAFAKLAQLDARAVEMAREQAGIKTAFTLDTEGEAPVLTAGVIREDGKYHTLEVSEYHSHNPCYKQKYEVWNEQQCELEQRLADMGIQV